MKIAALSALALLALASGGVGTPVYADDDQAPGTAAYRAFYGSFLPPTCCWTNGCCRRVTAGEVEALDGTMTNYRVVASGQEIKRSAWSPDGAIHLCQCDWDVMAVTRRGPATNARCIAVPPPAG